MIVKSFVGQCLLLAGLMMIVPVFAQQPTFPMLQDGGARSAFVGGTYLQVQPQCTKAYESPRFLRE